MLSFYFGGSFLPLSQSKVFYKFGFFDGIFGDFQEKHEFATLLKNTSALPRDFMVLMHYDLSVFHTKTGFPRSIPQNHDCF